MAACGYNEAMDMNISPAQLIMLEYLHAHTDGSGKRTGLDPKPLRRSLRRRVTHARRAHRDAEG